jgi:MarR family 2-MHQ and catechol resistance regulon transcriptional repressor
MKQNEISETSRALIEIAWHFGPKGLSGECCADLTMPEFIALDRIAISQDCAVSDVGHSLGFTKSGATRIVNRLEKKGYVKKIKSCEDSRVCCVKITKSGEQVLFSADLRYLEQFIALMSRLPEYSATDIAGMLIAIAKVLKA